MFDLVTPFDLLEPPEHTPAEILEETELPAGPICFVNGMYFDHDGPVVPHDLGRISKVARPLADVDYEKLNRPTPAKGTR